MANAKCPFNKMRKCDPECAMRVKVTISINNTYSTGKACAFAVMASNVDYSSAAVFVSDTTFTGNLKPREAGESLGKIMNDLFFKKEPSDTPEMHTYDGLGKYGKDWELI